MSHVADVIVWTFLDEDAAIGPVQEWLTANNHAALKELADLAGGPPTIYRHPLAVAPVE